MIAAIQSNALNWALRALWLIALALPTESIGKPEALSTWENIYEKNMFPPSQSGNNAATSSLNIGKCALCHLDSTSATTKLNSYGNAIKRNFPNPRPPGGILEVHRINAIKAAAALNSDNTSSDDPANTSNLDPVGTTNLDEILKSTQPGWNAGNLSNSIYAGKTSDPADQFVTSIPAPTNMGNVDPSTQSYARLGGLKAIAASSDHSCAVTNGGGVLCWGANYYGQLGDGTINNRLMPVSVSRLVDVASIALGYGHTCALTASGSVNCWGRNANGQLGDGTTTDRLTAVNVFGLTSGVAAISAGSVHTCALTTGGGVKCWGSNASGALGDGTTTDRLTPVAASGLTSGVVAIAVNNSHSCALTVSGGVKCWGSNAFGQLGDGTTTDRRTAVNVTGMTSGVLAIATGTYHTCAVTVGGGVYCWGYNFAGQLGDGTTTQRVTPVPVSGLAAGFSAVATNFFHTCALNASGGIKCWGANDSGQLGDGTITTRLTPVDTVGLAGGATAIAVGGDHTCALASDAEAKCWGYNNAGQVGDNTTQTRLTAVDVLIGFQVAIAAGVGHSCVVTSSSGIDCWGWNTYGELGDRTATHPLTAVNASGVDDAIGVVVGFSHSCSLSSGGGVRCWGYNGLGELGDGTLFDQLTPTDVSGLSSGVVQIAAGDDHACALTSGGGVKCWGWNDLGQLGDGTTTTRSTPVDVSGLSSGVIAIALGGVHSCALTAVGGVKCWGSNFNGELGDGSTTQRLIPVNVSGLAGGVKAVSAGGHTCALTSGGGVKCWGRNNLGQLGDGTTTRRLTPVDVSTLTSGVTMIAVGGAHTCAMTVSGGVKCWGWNDLGQLGDGTTNTRWTAVNVSGLTKGVLAVAAGSLHNCALTGAGGVQCWGDNREGQLGDGTTTKRLTATKVQYVPASTAIRLNATAYDFGSVVVGAMSSANIVMRNVGSSALIISDVSVSGHFYQTNDCGTGLPPQGSCTINVKFTPTSLGFQDGTLIVYSNAAGSPHLVALSGEGINPPGTLQFVVATQSIGEAVGTVSIDVTRAGGSAGAVGVNYATVAEVGGGKATAGVDYLPASGTLHWNDGETGTKSFAVTIINDAVVEGDETFLVNLSSPIGGATLGAPSSMKETIVDQSFGIRLLVPDGTSLKQTFSAYPETRWFVMTVEPGKTYVIEAAGVDGDLTANAIETLNVYAAGAASPPPETSLDCNTANGSRPPAVDVASDGLRCVLRTAPPSAGLQQNKRPVYVKVTRMNPATGGGAQFKIRAREATIYGRWVTTGNDFHVEVENTTGDAMCVEVTRYPGSGLSYTSGPGWSGPLVSFTLTAPAFGAVKQVIPKGSLVGTDGEGTLRLSACGTPTNLLPGGLHVSTYAFDTVENRYIYFFTSTANDGKTRSTW